MMKHNKFICNGCGNQITSVIVNATRYGKEHLCHDCVEQLRTAHTESDYADACNSGAAHSDDEVMP